MQGVEISIQLWPGSVYYTVNNTHFSKIMFWSLFYTEYQNNVLWWVKINQTHTNAHAEICVQTSTVVVNQYLRIWSTRNKKIVRLRKMLHTVRIWTNSNITTLNRNNGAVEVYSRSGHTILQMDKSRKPAADGHVVLSLNVVRGFKIRDWVLGHSFIYKLSAPFG
jgi:hypothetical protein